MKILWILISSFTIFQAVKAQEFEPILAAIHYNYKYVNDKTNKDKYMNEEIRTYLGRHSFFSESYDYLKYGDDLARQALDLSNEGHLTLKYTSSAINEYYYTNTQAKELVRIYEFQGSHFLINESYVQQNWKLSSEKKEIGGYLCQKAYTEYKGRNYTAWFTEEIPFPFGPWKLRGLPRLILEAYDDQKEIVFEYSGFDLLDGSQLKIGIEKRLEMTTMKEIKRLEKALMENPQAFYETFQGGKRIEIVVGRPKSAYEMQVLGKFPIDIVRDNSYNPSHIVNNPIEIKN